jgi:hypothetical protein
VLVSIEDGNISTNTACFGDLNGEFWLGPDKINRITSTSHNKLRIDMEDTSGNTTYAEYDSFAIASEHLSSIN